jgi:hypothetical protein
MLPCAHIDKVRETAIIDRFRRTRRDDRLGTGGRVASFQAQNNLAHLLPVFGKNVLVDIEPSEIRAYQDARLHHCQERNERNDGLTWLCNGLDVCCPGPPFQSGPRIAFQKMASR